jgi:DNA-directed RNA polymerase specialized sigma24 family protein
LYALSRPPTTAAAEIDGPSHSGEKIRLERADTQDDVPSHVGPCDARVGAAEETCGRPQRTAPLFPPGVKRMSPQSSPIAWMELQLEQELVAAAQKGDRDSFLELVRHYQRPVYQLAFAMTRDADDAASLAQETFVRAGKGIKDLPESRRFFPWVLRIARNLAVSLGRKRAGSRKSGGGDPLLRSFEELRPDEQMALALRVVQRLKYADVAALLDTSLGAAMVRLAQARALLLGRADSAGGGEP